MALDPQHPPVPTCCCTTGTNRCCRSLRTGPSSLSWLAGASGGICCCAGCCCCCWGSGGNCCCCGGSAAGLLADSCAPRLPTAAACNSGGVCVATSCCWAGGCCRLEGVGTPPLGTLLCAPLTAVGLRPACRNRRINAFRAVSPLPTAGRADGCCSGCITRCRRCCCCAGCCCGGDGCCVGCFAGWCCRSAGCCCCTACSVGCSDGGWGCGSRGTSGSCCPPATFCHLAEGLSDASGSGEASRLGACCLRLCRPLPASTCCCRCGFSGGGSCCCCTLGSTGGAPAGLPLSCVAAGAAACSCRRLLTWSSSCFRLQPQSAPTTAGERDQIKQTSVCRSQPLAPLAVSVGIRVRWRQQDRRQSTDCNTHLQGRCAERGGACDCHSAPPTWKLRSALCLPPRCTARRCR